jgi:hypothetical protein
VASPASAAQIAHQQYLAQARTRFMGGVRATTRQIDAIYAKALRDVTADMARRLPTQPSARHLSMIQGALREAQANLSDQVLDATLHGISTSVSAATNGAQSIAMKVLGTTYEAAGIAAIYQTVNERAVLAFATRTRFDGLRLSDRVWQAASKWRGYVTRATESAIATGLPARDLARALDPYLKAGVAKPSSRAVRRRLGIPQNISYQSLRLARTEIATAFKEATVLGHSRTPSYLGSKWEISAGHTFTDECDDLASGGPQNDGVYPMGDEPLQPHPNCMCVLSPIHQDPAEFTDRLRSWVDDPSSDPELERWHQTVAKPFFNGTPINVPQLPARTRVLTGTSRAVRPGIKPARAIPPRATSSRQAATQTLPAPVTAEDAAEQLAKAARAAQEAEAARIARAAEEAAEAAARAELERIRALEKQLADLDRIATRQGSPRAIRTVDEATDLHISKMRTQGKMSASEAKAQREAIRLKYRDAGIEEFSLEDHIARQKALNDAFYSGADAMEAWQLLSEANRPMVTFVKREILGNGGTGAGEVYGHTVALYDDAVQKMFRAPYGAEAVAGEIEYQLGRAIYRNTGLIPESVQQHFINLLQSRKASLERLLGEGIDRAEGLFGALFRRRFTDLRPAQLKTWDDDLLKALDLMESHLPIRTKMASREIGKRAKAAELAAAKAREAAAKAQGNMFKDLPDIGQPGGKVTATEGKAFAKGSKAPRLTHRTSRQAANTILREGVDIDANTTAMYGKGFYTAEITPQAFGANYGDDALEVYTHVRNPLIVRDHNDVRAIHDRWRAHAAQSGQLNIPFSDAVREQALREGYDAIHVSFGGRYGAEPDYWVILDARSIRVGDKIIDPYTRKPKR